MSAIMMTDKLQREVETLDNLTREELVERWRKAHGCPPPKGIKHNLLLHSAAWHLQERRLGRLKGDAKRTLQRLMKARSTASPVADTSNDRKQGTSSSKQVRHLRGRLAPGVRLVREWNGRIQVVEVTGSGFLHDGKTYRSLTAEKRRDVIRRLFTRITATRKSRSLRARTANVGAAQRCREPYGDFERSIYAKTRQRPHRLHCPRKHLPRRCDRWFWQDPHADRQGAGQDVSEVSRLLPFAFLAPQLVESILAGNQPFELGALRLGRISELPVNWQKQAELLGF
jgi:hypothetical protein